MRTEHAPASRPCGPGGAGVAAWVAAAALAAALAACQSPSAPPSARLQKIDGQGFHDLVRASGGRPLVVNFWATWCEPCREEIPALESLHRDLGGSVRVVGVSVDNPGKIDQVRQYLASQGVSFPQYIRADADDEAFIAAVDPEWSGAVPATFLYDGAGERAARLVGRQSRDSLESALHPLLAGRPIPPPSPSPPPAGSGPSAR